MKSGIRRREIGLQGLFEVHVFEEAQCKAVDGQLQAAAWSRDRSYFHKASHWPLSACQRSAVTVPAPASF